MFTTLYMYITEDISSNVYNTHLPDIKFVHDIATGMIEFAELFFGKELSKKYIIYKCRTKEEYLLEFDFCIDVKLANTIFWLYSLSVSLNPVISSGFEEDTKLFPIFSFEQGMSFKTISMGGKDYPDFSKPIPLDEIPSFEDKIVEIDSLENAFMRIFDKKTTKYSRKETKFTFYCKENTIEEYISSTDELDQYRKEFKCFFLECYADQ